MNFRLGKKIVNLSLLMNDKFKKSYIWYYSSNI